MNGDEQEQPFPVICYGKRIGRLEALNWWVINDDLLLTEQRTAT